jgi:hypothetical protein
LLQVQQERFADSIFDCNGDWQDGILFAIIRGRE